MLLVIITLAVFRTVFRGQIQGFHAMNTDFETTRRIFLAIVEQPSAQWEVLLNEACGNDPVLRQQVARLLQAHAKGEGILDRNQAGRTTTGVYESVSERP